MVIVITYLKEMSFFSQSDTRSRAAWLMYLVTVQVKKEDWKIFKCRERLSQYVESMLIMSKRFKLQTN